VLYSHSDLSVFDKRTRPPSFRRSPRRRPGSGWSFDGGACAAAAAAAAVYRRYDSVLLNEGVIQFRRRARWMRR